MNLAPGVDSMFTVVKREPVDSRNSSAFSVPNIGMLLETDGRLEGGSGLLYVLFQAGWSKTFAYNGTF